MQGHPVGRLERVGWAVAAEDDSLPEGNDEDLAIRTVAEMAAYFLTNVGGEFVVDIGGELPEKL